MEINRPCHVVKWTLETGIIMQCALEKKRVIKLKKIQIIFTLYELATNSSIRFLNKEDQIKSE